MASGRDEAGKLAVEYFRQLGEAGETEVYLPSGPGRAEPPRAHSTVKTSDTAASMEAHVVSTASETPAAPATPETPAAPATPEAHVVSTASETHVVPATLETTDVPAVEVIRVTLAFSSDATNCELASGRTNVVFGAGNARARLMFIGEAPGRDEDIQGVPFVGRSGQLLNKILEAAGIERDDVYIANIIKCRPPSNRTPLTNEIEACIPYLGRQVALIAPRIICTLGLPATQTLLGIRGSMGSLRGKMYVEGDVKVIPTYHPAAALRDPKYKRPIWDDIQLIKREYEKA